VEISDHCKSVIACRVSPKQKQEVVSLVRKEVKFQNNINKTRFLLETESFHLGYWRWSQ
jgi:hypothetical protein